MNRDASPYLAWRLDRWRLLLLTLLFALLLYGALRWPLLGDAPLGDATQQPPTRAPIAALPAMESPLPTRAPSPTTTAPSIQPPPAPAVDGLLTFSGTAPTAARVLLLVDGEIVGKGRVDAQQRWRLEISTVLPPGRYTAQAAALDGAGAVIQLSTPITFTTAGP